MPEGLTTAARPSDGQADEITKALPADQMHVNEQLATPDDGGGYGQGHCGRHGR